MFKLCAFQRSSRYEMRGFEVNAGQQIRTFCDIRPVPGDKDRRWQITLQVGEERLISLKASSGRSHYDDVRAAIARIPVSAD